MKLKVLIGPLTDTVTQATATIDHKLDALSSNVYLRAVKKAKQEYLYAFATDMTSRTLGKVEAEVEEEGEISVPPGKLLAGLAARPREEQVELSTVGSKDSPKLEVRYRKNRFIVPINPDVSWLSQQMNDMPLKGKPNFTMLGSSLAEFCRRGLFCVPTDSLAPTGVKMGMHLTDNGEGYEAEASDGSIAVKIHVKAEKSDEKLGSLILPYKALTPLSRLLARRGDEEVKIILGSKGSDGNANEVFFKFGDAFYGTRPLAGAFPNLKSVFEGTKSDHHFSIDRESLYGALGRASSFLPDKRIVNLELKKDVLEIKSTGPIGEVIEEVLEVEPEGKGPSDPVKITVNLDYLFNIANGSKSSKLSLGMSGPSKAMEIRDTEDEVVHSQYVLMGVR